MTFILPISETVINQEVCNVVEKKKSIKLAAQEILWQGNTPDADQIVSAFSSVQAHLVTGYGVNYAIAAAKIMVQVLALYKKGY